MEISLSRGLTTLVDDDDFEVLKQWKWHADKDGYAVRTETLPSGKRKIVRMHRFIMKVPEGMVSDHIDGNPHNNRVSNLKLATHLDNSLNAKKRSNNVSGLTGVSYSKSNNSWRAVWHNGEGKQIGKSFSVKKYGEANSKQMAIDARNNAISKLIEDGFLYTERHGK